MPGLLWQAGTAGADAPAQERVTVFDLERSFLADGSRGPYRVSDRAILPESESVWVGGQLQQQTVDYHVDPEGVLLVFSKEISRGVRVLIRFRQIPQVLNEVYRRRETTRPESKDADEVIRRSPPRRVDRATEFTSEPGLEIGGSKRIQVGFGGNRSAELNQSLQIHISGEIAEGVELTALLSDRNLPLQANGQTQSLQELDQVMFQVRARSVSAGLGDMDVVFDETTFGRYHRRLQGANFAFFTGDTEAQLYGAVSRGQWISHRLSVVEGYQGPYVLPVASGGSSGQIVAGSERVYWNGRLLRRGEGQDYVTDYERGTITFTPSWAVTGESRVLVEFQHADGAQRRLLGVGGRMGVMDGRLKLGATFLRETDQAGSSELSVGRPYPSRQQVAVLDGTYLAFEGLKLEGELALSASSQTDFGRGRAFRAGVDFWPEELRVSGRSLGRVRLSGSYRDVGATFSGFERTDRVDHEGRWGWQEDRAGERLGEVRFEYTPRQGLRLDAGYGRRVGQETVARRELGFLASGVGTPRVAYRYESIDQAGSDIDADGSGGWR
ncbi:MAG: hypothetical protein O2954_05150, partial [bacterium]|nr:hypothetical protein [bacterium]